MSKKPVIVFEGIEASGKSHHILNVTKYLKRKKLEYIKLREPGGNSNSEKIRKLILNNKSNFDRNTDLLLYLAARNENMSLLKKNYKKKIILIDRFVDSTIAYQHYGFGVDIKFINFINKYLLKKFRVDFTFLNIVNSKNMMKRLKIRKKLNRYDKFNNQFYTNVQNGFIKLAKKNMNRYKIINSNLDIKSNEDQVIQKINQLI
tara:strand:+ start:52 stop:663 length:612 start_codon:yes stop_codon:yes gene_type:complete